MPIIDMKATGVNIKTMIKQNGFKIADVQARCGFNTPQAIFKWMRGDAAFVNKKLSQSANKKVSQF